MSDSNSKRNILLPIFFALTLVVGVFVGYVLRPTGMSRSMLQSKMLPQFDKVNTILQLLSENYVDPIKSDSLQELVIPHILEALDPHTSYIPAAEMQAFNEPLKGNFDGIGVQFNIQNDTILIVNTIPGGPSEKIGVMAGDRIIFINDTLFAGTGVTNDDVVKNLKGESGTKVRIKVKRRGISELIEFTIKRDKIPIYSVDVSYMLNKETGYLKISQFAATTHKEFLQATEKLKKQGMKKLVLDLRQNGGGYLDAAVKIADEFLPDGKMIVYMDGNAQKRTDYIATKSGTCEDIELAVLIDSWSASASEIVAGAIQDNDRGVIVGRRSYGKGLVQEPFVLNDGSEVRITIARYYSPTGRCIQKPYDKGLDNYHADYIKRSMDGELLSSDSVHLSDTVKYTTPGGKIVYGGGGIMPDVFVPQDTAHYSKYLDKLITKGTIYNFAIAYTDDHRKALSTLKTPEAIVQYLDKDNMMTQFKAYAAKNGVKENASDLVKSGTEIEVRIKAYIARNILDDAGFYPVLRKTDSELKRAELELQKSN